MICMERSNDDRSTVFTTTIKKVSKSESGYGEIINLRAILALPKGTEYFLSDLHGEHNAFVHMLKSASGVIKSKNR